MSSKPFQFKQFTVQQDRCAMKIGTDGVLLGAWASIDHSPGSILDIGAGTGIISLMLAQRSEAFQIDAIEIEENAYEQTVDNFEASDWGDRLFCYHAGFDEFVEEMQDEEQYDLIISNPPFYSEDYKSLRKQNYKLWYKVLSEDIKAVEGMQEGRNSPAYNGGNFSPVMDSPTHLFHQWVAKNLV